MTDQKDIPVKAFPADEGNNVNGFAGIAVPPATYQKFAGTHPGGHPTPIEPLEATFTHPRTHSAPIEVVEEAVKPKDSPITAFAAGGPAIHAFPGETPRTPAYQPFTGTHSGSTTDTIEVVSAPDFSQLGALLRNAGTTIVDQGRAILPGVNDAITDRQTAAIALAEAQIGQRYLDEHFVMPDFRDPKLTPERDALAKIHFNSDISTEKLTENAEKIADMNGREYAQLLRFSRLERENAALREQLNGKTREQLAHAGEHLSADLGKAAGELQTTGHAISTAVAQAAVALTHTPVTVANKIEAHHSAEQDKAFAAAAANTYFASEPTKEQPINPTIAGALSATTASPGVLPEQKTPSLVTHHITKQEANTAWNANTNSGYTFSGGQRNTFVSVTNANGASIEIDGLENVPASMLVINSNQAKGTKAAHVRLKASDLLKSGQQLHVTTALNGDYHKGGAMEVQMTEAEWKKATTVTDASGTKLTIDGKSVILQGKVEFKLTDANGKEIMTHTPQPAAQPARAAQTVYVQPTYQPQGNYVPYCPPPGHGGWRR